MRCIALNELALISGGIQIELQNISDSFLAGMKNEDITPYLTFSMTVGAVFCGVLTGAATALATHSILWGMAGSIGGGAFGSGISYLGTSYEYHRGQNYVAAMNVLNH